MLDRTTEIVPRSTAEAIVRQRDVALRAYEEAYTWLSGASEACKKAHALARAICPREGRFNHHLHGDKAQFMHVAEVQDRIAYLAIAKRIVDTEAWAHVLEITDLERLMDKKAKDDLHQQLLAEPPEATVENIYATLETFASQADLIFQRGIANCFSNLDRRFRSHDGFRIGSRVILDRMFDERGWWNYNRDMESTLLDIERTFLVLDGRKVPPSYAGIVGQLRDRRNGRGGNGPRQDEVADEFFTIRVFKNGNCHVWFKRDDLLERVNKLLAEYYGEVIGDGMTPEDDGGLYTAKTVPAKRYGFFPTPDEAAAKLIETAELYRSTDTPKLRILEPSAGTGSLAKLCALASTEEYDTARSKRVKRRFGHTVDCVEIQPVHVQALNEQRLYNKVWGCDFLSLKPETTGLYDRVVANPPFDRERDIDHVIHALKFLNDDGMLVAIMSAGTEFRETRKAIAFRKLVIEQMHGKFFDLPAGSFSSVGTNVNTLILKVYKDGRTFWR